jgi:hypothetical protein
VKGLIKSLILPFILLNTLNHPLPLPHPSYILYPILYIFLYPHIPILLYPILLGRAILPPFRLTLHYHIIPPHILPPPSTPPPSYITMSLYLHSVTHSMILSDKHLIVTILTYPPPPPIKLKLKLIPLYTITSLSMCLLNLGNELC